MPTMRRDIRRGLGSPAIIEQNNVQYDYILFKIISDQIYRICHEIKG
jgi:hypothetical protein